MSAAATLDLPPGSGGDPHRLPRVLIVDDQPASIHILYQAFAPDHQVFMATTAGQALALCASRRPDIVLLDVVMPDMSGHEVCRRLRADESTRDIPVIFVTAHDGDEAETFGLDIGAVDFISKPVNPRIVRARVRTQLLLKAQSDALRQWAHIDALTGLHNRRHFDEQLAAEWRRTYRNGSALSVMLIGVDHFTRYNERYGCAAGDRSLRLIAATLKAGLRRPADLVARSGGEEFAFLLPETPLPGAVALAQQLRESVLAQRLEHAEAPAAIVTLSVGVCSRGGRSGGTPTQLLGQADAQLSLAKTGGCDRLCAAEFVAHG